MGPLMLMLDNCYQSLQTEIKAEEIEVWHFVKVWAFFKGTENNKLSREDLG